MKAQRPTSRAAVSTAAKAAPSLALARTCAHDPGNSHVGIGLADFGTSAALEQLREDAHSHTRRWRALTSAVA